MRAHSGHAHSPAVVKVEEMVGFSRESWDEAARMLVARASKSIYHITGLDVLCKTAVIIDGKITEYHVTAKVAFEVEQAASEQK
ncbi:dodecin family protein [Singulisphaera sp. PoT]|uniref:dodecin family protein n=1 Tax=Singulisphaera sp. PoT TaxID=3411797 RepID=UPI003BF5F8DF